MTEQEKKPRRREVLGGRAAEYLVSVDLVVIAESEEQAEQHVRDKVLGDTYGLSSEITYTEHMRDLGESE